MASQEQSPHPRRVVLGPQGRVVTLGDELDALEEPGPVALINAGWQDREPAIDELVAAARRKVVTLDLYARWEAVVRHDPGLADAHRERQDLLRQLQELYRRRLIATMTAARAMWAETGPSKLIGPERKAAIAAARALDRHHLSRVRFFNREFEKHVAPGQRAELRRHRQQVAELIAPCRTVLVAGGHVLVLLNRMRLLGLREHLQRRNIVAWSAGAMALTERVVLFHDHPPQGEGDPELIDRGLGLLPNAVLLPHAPERLRLSDRGRVERFALRFDPAVSVSLTDGSRITYDGSGWRGGREVARLTDRGGVEAITGW